tara:strand:+ start:272 stop:634 length:363 start_codon:yes stop_codon:yes gene_type:complete
MEKLFMLLISVVLLTSCNKYSEKVSGTYTGHMLINDTITSNNNIIISEISNKRISIAGDFFNIDELEIEKQRYFGSVTYFHNGDSHTNLDLEIGETSTGLYLSLVYYDTLNNQYVFSGEN